MNIYAFSTFIHIERHLYEQVIPSCNENLGKTYIILRTKLIVNKKIFQVYNRKWHARIPAQFHANSLPDLKK